MDFVKGYLTQADENGDVRHVAVFKDGSIKITRNRHPRSGHYFSRPNWAWDEIEEMPDDLEYIGQYAVTKEMADV